MRMRIPDRRHSTDGSCGAPASGSGSGSGSGSSAAVGSRDSFRFHPYRRQFSEGSAPASGDLQHCSPYYSCFQDPESPGAFSATCGSSSETQLFWEQYNSRFMGTQGVYAALPATPVEPPYYLSQSQAACRPLGPQLILPMANATTLIRWRNVTPPHYTRKAPSHALFPKPIYSYSILIFMALKNSKTGSLPVSEIYNFMTDHFPYFKTAPDGWKNSVRHNLSLNKCFEKVESKNGNSSRKGCLWALNPTKVDKMHEELHKWRRKDPVTVRKSMARPEELDRLLGEKPEKITPLSAYLRQPSLAKHSPVYDKTALSLHTCALRDPCVPTQRPHYPPIPTPAQQYGYPSNPNGPRPAASRFPLYSPCRQQPLSGLASALGGLSSAYMAAGRIPPPYHASAHTDYAIVPRSMQDMHVDGDASYDVDTLNPSLTDLQLHENLWEELRDDSMVPDPLANITTAFTLPLDHIQSHSLQALVSVNQNSQDSGVVSEQHNINGLYPMTYSGVESLAGYLTSCPTPISLM
ncbi:Forkhead box protein N1 [Merluccius polli]|uniref:Forkhead box protein N1 n=1 Tax=Merluccius polli TaxID=89951 RepID=A0AA47MHA1_MERPO|nr:Forkhead box protein N1 [Merluccius polli]